MPPDRVVEFAALALMPVLVFVITYAGVLFWFSVAAPKNEKCREAWRRPGKSCSRRKPLDMT